MSLLELARFALYADLGVVVGVPAAVLLTRAADWRSWHVVTAATLLGLPLSVLVYLLTVAEMTGTGLADLDWQVVSELATTTAVGWAFLVRSAALGLAAALCFAAPARTWWHVAPGVLALASLAWSGHAAASEGTPGLWRIATDIVHLLVAAVWLGAMVLFLVLLRPSNTAPQAASAQLERFAGIGSVLVAVLVLTGLANFWFLVPFNAWRNVPATAYGELLAIKLGLFGVMLTLAALHRFVLVPHLVADASNDRLRTRLRGSIFVELVAALAILGIVARLGLLDPSMP
jgi:putative copper resistance protein D